jgi:hypothetical protein
MPSLSWRGVGCLNTLTQAIWILLVGKCGVSVHKNTGGILPLHATDDHSGISGHCFNNAGVRWRQDFIYFYFGIFGWLKKTATIQIWGISIEDFTCSAISARTAAVVVSVNGRTIERTMRNLIQSSFNKSSSEV